MRNVHARHKLYTYTMNEKEVAKKQKKWSLNSESGVGSYLFPWAVTGPDQERTGRVTAPTPGLLSSPALPVGLIL